jgi:hypothetical protein
MTRAQQVAKGDAQTSNRCRKIKDFFGHDSGGVCALCGHGLGKGYTKEKRREHEKSEQHLRNHKIYVPAFQQAVEERLAHQELMKQIERKEIGRAASNDALIMRSLADALLARSGASAWINEGDGTRLKAALFDVLMGVVERPRAQVQHALNAHVHATQRVFAHRAARAALGDNADGAWTAAILVTAWL